MNTTHSDSQTSKEPVLPRSHRLIRHLTLLYGLLTLVVAVALAAGWLPASVLPQFRALAREAAESGAGAITLAALLLAETALLGTLALTAARVRYAGAGAESGSGAASTAGLEAMGPRDALALREDPGAAARVGQALIAPVGALLVCLAIRFLWPTTSAGHETTSANIAGAFMLAFAFVSLVCERVMNAFPAPQLPEAPSVRRLLLLATLLLAAAACIEFGHGASLRWLSWPARVIACIPGLVVVELAVRALGRLFLPAPSPADARAVTDSLAAGLLTGGPRAPATLLRTHLGLDFARSWALSFLGAALLPALFGTALLCWGLSGLKLIELGHRGVYERFGAPVAVLGPGLHLLLPWPLGRLRPVEYGTIHAVPIGVDQSAAETHALIGAEATPPLSLNRLWETAHADQAHYLVPSSGTAEQSFQSVATEIYVLYRVGLTDRAALASVYTVADPESLIRELASGLVLRYFNSRTLEEVIGARRQSVAGSLREQLAAEPAVRRAGIDIVSVLIEEIHPPAGAAAAYHAVQAAEVNANAAISNERGRAKRTAGTARQEAHQLIAAANARAAEITSAAEADAYRFAADRRAYGEGRRPFLLERRLDALEAALAHVQLTLVDSRLSPDQRPILDLRSLGGSGGGLQSGSVGGAVNPLGGVGASGGASSGASAGGAANGGGAYGNAASGAESDGATLGGAPPDGAADGTEPPIIPDVTNPR